MISEEQVVNANQELAEKLIQTSKKRQLSAIALL